MRVCVLVRSRCGSRACVQNVLQHVAVCCSALPCLAVSGIVLQFVAVCCSLLQCAGYGARVTGIASCSTSFAKESYNFIDPTN